MKCTETTSTLRSESLLEIDPDSSLNTDYESVSPSESRMSCMSCIMDFVANKLGSEHIRSKNIIGILKDDTSQRMYTILCVVIVTARISTDGDKKNRSMQILSEWTIVEDVLADAQSVSSISEDRDSCSSVVEDIAHVPVTNLSEVNLVNPLVPALMTEVCRLRRRNLILRRRLHAHLSRQASSGSFVAEFCEYIIKCFISVFSLTENTKFEWTFVQLNSRMYVPTGIDPKYAKVRSVPLRAGRLVGSLFTPDLSYQRMLYCAFLVN